MAKKADSKNYAGFGVRLVAALIDGIVLAIVQYFLRFAFPESLHNPISLVISLAYSAFMIYQYQATLGKMALKLKVVPEEGKKLTIGQILLREWVGKLLSGVVFLLGYFWVAFDGKKQGWHDKLARTLVIREK